MFSVALWLLVSCGGTEKGCLHRDLDVWCHHEESEGGPVESDETCASVSFEAGEGAYRCGDYDVTPSGPDFTGRDLYFDHETGELVAVRYWTDVNTYCGGFSYWYGERVLDCTAECTYDTESDSGLPVCE